MKASLLLLSLLLAVAQVSTSDSGCECGIPSVHPRIIGGRPAVPNRYPWIVWIRSAGGWDSCTGSLLSDSVVLTAGHCVPDHLDPFSMSVHMSQECGSLSRTWSPDKGIKVAKITRHPGFGSFGHGNDAALLHLQRPGFGQPSRRVMPICLTRNHSRSFDHHIIAGWGLANEGRRRVLTGCLNEADVVVHSEAECAILGEHFSSHPERIACVGGERNICKGDSGGPLMSSHSSDRMFLTGIASFSRADCSILTHTPAGFERTDHLIDWITSNADGVCVK